MNDICFMFHVFSHDLSKYSILAVESMKKFWDWTVSKSY
jgi:hypothetical protein